MIFKCQKREAMQFRFINVDVSITLSVIVYFLSTISFAEGASTTKVYKLLMSKDQVMCSYMLNKLNGSLKKTNRNEGERCGQKYVEVDWLPIKGQRKDKYAEPSIKFTLIDLNNDGKEDYVSRYQGCCYRNRFSTSLSMLDENKDKPNSVKEMYESSTTISNLTYSLKLENKDFFIFPERVEVFQFNNIHYISMYETTQYSGRNYSYVVITKLTGNEFDADRQQGLEDICYFKTKKKN